MRKVLTALRAFVLVLPPFWCGIATADTTRDPIIRVETGDHEAVVNRVVRVPDGSVLSVSDDKTARLWSAITLEPRGILRPSVGARDDGAIAAVAASSNRIAIGGRIRDQSGQFAVTLYGGNGVSYRGSLGELPAPVTALRFSPSEDVLAIGMLNGSGMISGASGIRLVNLRTRSVVVDSDFGGSVTWMDFAPDGRLVVASDDGTLRLYDKDGKLIVKMDAPSGMRPVAVAFSPDGSKLAIGDRKNAAVLLLDGRSLRLIRTLSGAPKRGGAFHAVAFSAGGDVVWGAGSYADPSGNAVIRRWNLKSGATSETSVATDTVMDLLPAADGAYFASAEPSIGYVDANGRLGMVRKAVHADMRSAGPFALRVSRDGAAVRMPGRGSGSDLVFDIKSRTLSDAVDQDSRMAPPMEHGSGATVVNWRDSVTPRVNGRSVALERNERVRSVAVGPLGGSVAMGTDFYIRYLKGDQPVWSTVVNAPAWAVNISGDGRLVVAALGDGTLAWLDAQTGEQLLVLFVEPETRRWVLFLPRDGFFDHDHRFDGRPDGRTLIGYQFNAVSELTGKFIQIGQLYPLFFRPDLVELAFRNDRLSRQVIADQHERAGGPATVVARGLPGKIAIMEACPGDESADTTACVSGRSIAVAATQPPVTSAGVVRLRYQIKGQRGQPGAAIVRRNAAVLAPTVKVISETDDSRTEQAIIPLSLGENKISLTAVSAGGLVEAPPDEVVSVKVVRRQTFRGSQGRDTAQSESDPVVAPKPEVTLRLLAVGISRFQHPSLTLANAAHDARAVFHLMNGGNPPIYDKVDPTILLDRDATIPKITAALQHIIETALPDDLVVIFFSGHGRAVDGRYYFAPVDLGMGNRDLFRTALNAPDPVLEGRAYDQIFRTEGLGQEQLMSFVKAMQATRVAMILDTCFSASLATETMVMRYNMNQSMTQSLGYAGGRFVLSSAYALAADSDSSLSRTSDDGDEHGLFTSFLLRGLNGEADLNRTGRIDIYTLTNFTKGGVEAASRNGSKSEQVPAFYFAGNDFFGLHAVEPSKDAKRAP